MTMTSDLVQQARDHYVCHKRKYAGVLATGSFLLNLYWARNAGDHGFDITSWNIDDEMLTTLPPWVKATTAAAYKYAFWSNVDTISGYFKQHSHAVAAMVSLDFGYKAFEFYALKLAGTEHPAEAMALSAAWGVAKVLVIADLFREDGLVQRGIGRWRKRDKHLAARLESVIRKDDGY